MRRTLTALSLLLSLALVRAQGRVQRLRLEAGSISALTLARAELQVRQQEAQLAVAGHALAAAVRQVELTVMGTP
jgi:hypothetical protein